MLFANSSYDATAIEVSITEKVRELALRRERKRVETKSEVYVRRHYDDRAASYAVNMAYKSLGGISVDGREPIVADGCRCGQVAMNRQDSEKR